MERISLLFITIFMDLIHRIQEDWEILLSSIRDGIIPDIEHHDHIRTCLQVGTGLFAIQRQNLRIAELLAC